MASTNGGWKSYLQARRKAVAAVVLLAGVAAGLVIYLTTPPPQQDVLGNPLDQSKAYLREVETYGGNANVLATEIREWFVGLWQRPTLGITVACLSALLAAIVYLALIPLPARGESGRGRRP